jgi:hypothetical protein
MQTRHATVHATRSRNGNEPPTDFAAEAVKEPTEASACCWLTCSPCMGDQEFKALYRAWKQDGEPTLTSAGSRAIGDAVEAGAGRVETLDLWASLRSSLAPGYGGLTINTSAATVPSRCVTLPTTLTTRGMAAQ